ncbi:MAG TPA: hypothetical protein VK543_09250 [Puia sp.]|nr:hypothetical protein [Puia sp.]
MKNKPIQIIAFISGLFFIFFFVGWSKKAKSTLLKESPTQTNRTVLYDIFLPSSCQGGQIEIKCWEAYSDGNTNSIQTNVDADFVLIGGGARVTNTSNTDAGVNAILVSCAPIDDGTFTKFLAQSKQHFQTYYHRCWVYAIGLKIFSCTGKCPSPLNPSQIIPFLNLASVMSPLTNHPSAIVSPPAGYKALSGGAFVDQWFGVGNLLVECGYPSVLGYLTSSSKDQVQQSPATITAYCISFLASGIPCAGQNPLTLLVQNKNAQVTVTQHAQSLSLTADAGYALSGIGGFSNYNTNGGYGRLLYALYPQTAYTGIVNSKDQGQTDISGNLQISLFEIKPGY